MSEAIALRDLDLDMLSDEVRDKMIEARKKVRELKNKMRSTYDNPDYRQTDRSLVQELGEARKNLLDLIATTRIQHPDFMPTGLKLSELLNIIPDDGALVVPIITLQGSAIFIVPGGEVEIDQSNVIFLDNFKDDDLSSILKGTKDKPGWLTQYKSFRDKSKSPQESIKKEALDDWQLSIDETTERLWENIIKPIHKQLAKSGINQVIFMPAGGLQLLPLHAAWREEQGKKRSFIDDYQVTVIPSGYVMQTCHQRVKSYRGKSAFVACVSDYNELESVTAKLA